MTTRQMLARAHGPSDLEHIVPVIQSYSLLTSLLVTFSARTSRTLRTEGTPNDHGNDDHV